jgi:TRAP-type C4-dicarboxylate transport system substrate-binding protein
MVSYDKVFPEFVESVEKMSGGRLILTMHPGGALVPLTSIHDAVGAGSIEIGFSTGAFWAGTVAEQNVHLLSPLIGVPYGSIMSSEPIRSLDDLDGKKIRTIGYFGSIWEAFGASPTMTDIAEIYTSVAQGVVDGANIGNPARFAAINLQEVAKYYTMPPLSAYASGEFFVNLDKWNELPEDLQEILTVAAQRASTGFATYFAYEDAEALETFRDASVEINTFSDAEVEQLRQVAVGVWDALAQQDEYTQEVVDITKEYMRYLGRLD